MASMNIYLNFSGYTEEVFNFYKSVFGGEFNNLQRYSDIDNLPGKEHMSESDINKLMHVSLPLGNGTYLMGTDALESLGHTLTFGNNISISLETDTIDEANSLFEKLTDGGTVTMPLEHTFWGAYFGMLTDKFGIQWMVNCDLQSI